MNIILLGGSVSKRLKIKNDLKNVLCNQSYVYHSKDNLTNSAWLNSTKALVICGDFNEPTEYILNKFKETKNGIIFEATDDIASQVKELSLNLGEPKNQISKYYGCYYQKTNDGPPRTEDVQLTADGNLIYPDEYYFYGESFQFEKYFEKLRKTNLIGRHIYHFNTISSTMNFFNDKNEWNSRVVLADIQDKGKGRKENEWISPKGSISVSFGFSFDLNLEHPAAIQHLIGLSICKILRLMTSSDKIRLKWPNDIYWENSIKLGGLLVKSSILGSNMVVCCGAGLNLSNEKPLPGIEILTGSKITREIFLAKVFNDLETKLSQLKDGSWRDDYYSVWCHKNDSVTTEEGDGKLIGLDLDGFLLVELKSGQLIRFDTDNNSFDLMQGLISRK